MMLLGMVSALADDDAAAATGKITVQNAAKGETYKIFKIFDATISGDSIAYTYSGTLPNTLAAVFEKIGGTDYVQVKEAYKDKDADIIFICQCFYGRKIFVVLFIGVCGRRFAVADQLQCVDEDDAGVRILRHHLPDLDLQRFADGAAVEGDVHVFRRLIDQRKYGDDFRNLVSVRPEYIDSFVRMMALDFITRQDDRHLSNLAVKISGDCESFYPLYDNGRSLFYEDTEETVGKAVQDIEKYSTAFGPEGSYYDHILKISEMGISFRKLLDLDVTEQEICEILSKSGFDGYRLDGAYKWIMKCLGILRELG